MGSVCEKAAHKMLMKLTPDARQRRLFGRDHDTSRKFSDEQSCEIRIGINQFFSGKISFIINMSDQNSAAYLELPGWSDSVPIIIERDLVK
jgi:hypothetical protein